MAEVNNKVIRITVETDKAKIKIEGVEQYFRKAETAAKALNKILDQNTKHWGRTESALSQQISSLKDLRAKTAGTTEEYQRQTKEIDKLQAEYEQLTTAQGKVSKSMGSMQSSAGLAGATVNELGRTISDMPYGITAISNNISQLGSLFAILVSKTGSVQKAFKSLYTTLRASPALLVLLAFQSAVAIMDVFAQNARKAKASIDDFAKAAGGAATELRLALDYLDDENVSLEDKQELMSNVNKEYSEMNIRLTSNNRLMDDSREKMLAQIDALAKMAQAQALVSQIQKVYEDIAVLESKTAESLVAGWKKVAIRFASFGLSANKNIKELGEKNRGTLAEELDKTLKLFKEKLEQNDLYKQLLGGEDSEATVLNKLAAFLQKWKELREDSEAKTKLSLTNLEEKRVIEEARKLGASEQQLYDIRKVFSDKRIKLREEEYKQILKLQQEAFNEELDLIEEQNKQIDSLLKDITAKRKDEPLIRFSGYDFDDLDVDASIDELLLNNKKLEEERIQSLNDTIAVAQAVGAVVTGVADNIDAAYQKEISIEQNKTNALNNELRERLANEQLSADERRNIQDQIAKNDESLRKKQEAIERKRFKANKAAAIAEATISTFVAAAKTLRDTEGGSVARIAGMIAVIGAGLAQVVMISKQQFASSQSSIGAGVGAGSNGGGVQAPEFNIVGQSASNQIAAAVQGQFSQPIRAYVVSKDMSTAQEMDRNIIGASSLG
jgi:hypothetical protein